MSPSVESIKSELKKTEHRIKRKVNSLRLKDRFKVFSTTFTKNLFGCMVLLLVLCATVKILWPYTMSVLDFILLVLIFNIVLALVSAITWSPAKQLSSMLSAMQNDIMVKAAAHKECDHNSCACKTPRGVQPDDTVFMS